MEDRGSNAVDQFDNLYRRARQGFEAARSLDKATPSPLIYNNEALLEISLRTEQYQKLATEEFANKVERDRENRECDPIGSMANHVYIIRVEVYPESYHDDERLFEVTGEILDRNFHENVLATHATNVCVPSGAKTDFLAFSDLVERIAAQIPYIAKNRESDDKIDKAKRLLEECGYNVEKSDKKLRCESRASGDRA